MNSGTIVRVSVILSEPVVSLCRLNPIDPALITIYYIAYNLGYAVSLETSPNVLHLSISVLPDYIITSVHFKLLISAT